MSRRVLVAGALTALTLGCAGFSFAVRSYEGPIATGSGQRTYAKFAAKKQFRPSILYFGANQRVYSISWTKWGKKLARGTGTYPVNDCIPSCAEGTITPTPASVVLTGRTSCGKLFIFRRLKVFYGGRRTGIGGFCPKAY